MTNQQRSRRGRPRTTLSALKLAGWCLVATLAATAAWPAHAASFPSRSVRMIVPWPPGGGTDIIGRKVGQKLSEIWGQPVVIDNRPGAAGNIGADLAARAAPDGYTIALVTITIAVNPSLYPSAPNPSKDFAPLTLAADVPQLLVVNPAVKATTVAQLVALAQAEPGTLSYASAGVGSPLHLAGELFKTLAKVDILHVPYKGGAPAMNDVIAGQVSMMFGNLVSLLPQVQAGQLRALGLTSAHRFNLLPEIPTIAEAGVPGYGFGSWFGFVAPAATPPDIVDRLNRSIVQVLQTDDMRAEMAREGADLKASSPAAFGDFIASEQAKWHKVAVENHIHLD